jgi:hypothetical protein
MNKLLAAILATLFFSAPALAGGLDSFLQNVNVQARADMNGFSAKVSAQFGVPEAQVKVVLNKVGGSPADAFMVFQLGQMSNQQPEAVMQVYEANKGRGWGVIAQQLGIKPGSAEFHALKRGDLHYGAGAPAAAEEEHGHGNGHGRGHGHGHGRGHDEDD